MWLLVVALLTPPDPNATYQSLDKVAKERIYLVYDREIKARQKFDEAIDATAAATNFNGGVVRLVVSELRRDGKFLEEKKIQAKGLAPKPKKKSTATNPNPRRRASGAGNPARPVRNPNALQKEYTGDGITLEEGQEKVKFDGKTYKWFNFRRLCTFALGDQLAGRAEKEPILLDGVVTGLAKHWTVVDVWNADGQPGTSIVILKPPSTKTLRGLRKNDPVRLWGWLADESQTKAAEDAYSEEDESDPVASGTTDEEDEEEEEERASTQKQRPAGLVFFAMDLDEYRKQIPGLVLSTVVTNVAGSDEGKDQWEIEVTAKNEGSEKLVHIEVETTMVLSDVERTTKDPEDTCLVYFASIEPGTSATVKTKLPNWTGLDEEVIAVARPVNGRVAKP